MQRKPGQPTLYASTPKNLKKSKIKSAKKSKKSKSRNKKKKLKASSNLLKVDPKMENESMDSYSIWDKRRQSELPNKKSVAFDSKTKAKSAIKGKL
jgi:hypothetical protein